MYQNLITSLMIDWCHFWYVLLSMWANTRNMMWTFSFMYLDEILTTFLCILHLVVALSFIKYFLFIYLLELEDNYFMVSLFCFLLNANIIYEGMLSWC